MAIRRTQLNRNRRAATGPPQPDVTSEGLKHSPGRRTLNRSANALGMCRFARTEVPLDHLFAGSKRSGQT